ncbi:hypothetical protein AB6A40_002877 [Gnathostoma spinigerum]|uniref:Cytohesin Ubiquitin Protein Inducing domain-containing protein n=1 Tax=Gnathostoma spinigerum TaxID=75299 RepID=A0ABD6EGU1_9BILA
MPTASAGDGSSSSLPSISSGYSRKSEEEKMKDRELYQDLKKRRNDLEEKLLAKLDELRIVCIKEAEITGEMPQDIYKTLKPGESEPKVKRRIGTAFALDVDLLKRPIDTNDKLSSLETDIEIHRKIVAAAERLAKDKTTNKSVRKKRRKDLAAATQKLRGLELGLSQLRLSASKPDVSTHTDHKGTVKRRVWPSFSGDLTSTPLISRSRGPSLAKSCPTTPRGSFPDLRLNDCEKSEAEDDDREIRTTFSQCSQRCASTSSCSSSSVQFAPRSNAPSNNISNGLPPTPNSRSASQISRLIAPIQQFRSSTGECSFTNDETDNPLSNEASHNGINSSKNSRGLSNGSQALPLYENIGYKSPASYKSTYRQTNFPTLTDMNVIRRRVQRAHSEHSLPEHHTVHHSNLSQSNIPDVNRSSDVHSLKYGPNKVYDSDVQSMSRSSRHHEQIGAPTCPLSPHRSIIDVEHTSTSSNRRFDDMNLISNHSSKTSTNASPLRHAVVPTSFSLNNFTTASLDRRATRTRQTSCASIGAHHMVNSNATSTFDGDERYTREHNISAPAGSKLLQKLSPASARKYGTTFPVAHDSGFTSSELSKSLLPTSDVRFQHYQRCPFSNLSTAQCSSPPSTIPSPVDVVCPPGSSSPNRCATRSRLPPPSYPPTLRSTTSGVVVGNLGSLSKVTPTNTDPRMEALLDYYKDSMSRKGKTATIV